MFVDRKKELQFLNQSLQRDGRGQMILLYGRRRVGKTELIRHWAMGSGLPYTYWMAEKETAVRQRRKLFARLFDVPLDKAIPYGFDPEASLPTRRQFNRVLSEMPNSVLQLLLGGQVCYLQTVLPTGFGQTISLDTKAILAWVKENNPKAYIKKDRFNKRCQPPRDKDCKLGCKRRRNVSPESTPTMGIYQKRAEIYGKNEFVERNVVFGVLFAILTYRRRPLYIAE